MLMRRRSNRRIQRVVSLSDSSERPKSTLFRRTRIKFQIWIIYHESIVLKSRIMPLRPFAPRLFGHRIGNFANRLRDR